MLLRTCDISKNRHAQALSFTHSAFGYSPRVVIGAVPLFRIISHHYLIIIPNTRGPFSGFAVASSTILISGLIHDVHAVKTNV